eukprot:GHVU01227052.1.p1 GENE.GHVU01227052.1~~GHVU01227052.1.p1  ORF type:complete len:157 (-),score=10.38 GHVU01227052.1:438-908(-)
MNKEGIPFIIDAKRGDIGSTANAYARSCFGYFNAPAVTVSPYLGSDSMEPYLQNEKRGIFALCKTSNPGSNDLQTCLLSESYNGSPLYCRVASMCGDINSRLRGEGSKGGPIGLVVGATDVDALRTVRKLLPNIWILAPGVGAQGADLEEALAAGA